MMLGRLCIHPNINKWSKWKPVRMNKVSGLTITDLKSPAVNYGLNVPQTTMTICLFLNTNWTYLKPRVFIEPFRLADFRNNHQATRVMFINNPISFNAIDPTTVFTITANSNPSSDTVLGLEDFHNDVLGNLYFGVIVKNI